MALALLAASPAPLPAQVVRRNVGQLRITADLAEAHPGGLVVVRLNRSLGSTLAVLGGRRIPFFWARGGPRALVPVAMDQDTGEVTLGIELRTRRGRQRVAVPITVAPRAVAPLPVVSIPEERRGLLDPPGVVRDGRRVLQLLRTVSSRQLWSGAFRPPATTPPTDSFGSPREWRGSRGARVEELMDAIHGEYHRGLDYPVPVGTLVQAPAAGTVLFAGPLALTGETVVVDHGQGVISLLGHLLRAEVAAGQPVAAGERLGLSGESGIAPLPHLHWGVYLHTVAVDPRSVLRAVD